MSGPASRQPARATSFAAAALVAWACQGGPVARAATPPGAAAPATAPVVENSSLDAPLFYQLLIGEIELRAGHAGNAYEVILDAAKRQGEDALFQRAVDIALQARSADQALSAAQAWRRAKPRALPPLRYLAQIQLSLNRSEAATEALSAWLELAGGTERAGLIQGLPRLLQRLPDRQQALTAGTFLLGPYMDAAGTAVPARVAVGRLTLAAGLAPQALALAHQAQQQAPAAAGPVLLALDLLPTQPAAEDLVRQYLARSDAEPALRLAYVRVLTQTQRYADAATQLLQLTRDRPTLPDPWLTLGALRLELKQLPEADAALQRYLSLLDAPAAPPAAGATPPAAAAAADDEGDDDEPALPPVRSAEALAAGRTQAWLLLSQVAELRGDAPAAERWLAKVDNPQRLLEVQSRRASLLAKQGRLDEGRALIRSVPERTGDDARNKSLAEVQLLREARRWDEAEALLAEASARSPDDTDLIYERAMVAEKRERFDEMERLLRQVIALKPDHPHAHNALGYSLADRGQRLPEARELIRKALSLQPGDPFITDSLGWVEFRLGNRAEAIRLLRQAFSSRPDTEIAVHLGEVLWADGQADEARRIWREARGRDAGNEVLRETLARLKVEL